MSRSVTGLPDDMDRAEWQNGPEDAPCEPYEPAGRTLTPAEVAAEMRRICGPVLDRIRGVELSSHRCVHGLNLSKSRCGTCEPIGART